MNIFTAHPHRIGETYLQHMRFALKFGSKMILGGCACLIHAIFPFLFQTTGSRMIQYLQENFSKRTNDPLDS